MSKRNKRFSKGKRGVREGGQRFATGEELWAQVNLLHRDSVIRYEHQSPGFGCAGDGFDDTCDFPIETAQAVAGLASTHYAHLE